eukprot:gene4883-22324_t
MRQGLTCASCLLLCHLAGRPAAAAELPLEVGTEMRGEWRRDYDPNQKRDYWYNTRTGGSQWDAPPHPQPPGT